MSNFHTCGAVAPTATVPTAVRPKTEGTSMSTTTKQKTLVAASAAAISTIGLLTCPALAQAEPMFPLAPACDNYELGNSGALLQLNQSDGVVVQLPTSGPSLQNAGPGRVMYLIPGRTEGTFGNAYGGIQGRNINFTVKWDQGPGAGHTNTYTGRVGDDGFATGTTTSTDRATSNWRSTWGHNCVYKPPVQAPPPPPPPPPLPPPGRPNDRDSDGLFDADETDVYGTNPDIADTDGDGPDDGQEVFDGTDPRDPNDP
jgi:hypothetical protein